jgi:hypothetical protein
MIVNDPNIDIEDVIIAMRVCSGNNGIEALAKPPTWREKWLHAKMAWNTDLLASTVLGFKEYIEAYSTQPKVWKKDDEEKKIEMRKQKIPDQLLLAALLIKNTTLTEEEVWTMPIGKASWYVTALAYLEGADIDTISTEDEKKMEREVSELAKFQAAELAKIKEQQGRPRR